MVAVGFFLPLCSHPIHCETKQKLPGLPDPQGQDLALSPPGARPPGAPLSSQHPCSLALCHLPGLWQLG